jgi:hypothetical protein
LNLLIFSSPSGGFLKENKALGATVLNLVKTLQASNLKRLEEFCQTQSLIVNFVSLQCWIGQTAIVATFYD